MDEASSRKLEPIFGHNPFTEALSQTPGTRLSFRVWLFALPGKIKATEMHVTCSQSGVGIQESFVLKNKKKKKTSGKFVFSD